MFSRDLASRASTGPALPRSGLILDRDAIVLGFSRSPRFSPRSSCCAAVKRVSSSKGNFSSSQEKQWEAISPRAGIVQVTGIWHTTKIIRAGLGIRPAWPSPLSNADAAPFTLKKVTARRRRAVNSRSASAGTNRHRPTQEPETRPWWLTFFMDMFLDVRKGLEFLWEQPGQLHYIEWPSLQSTAKMAVLTVVVVAFLIVFLATIDSTFSFLLASMLRRVPRSQ